MNRKKSSNAKRIDTYGFLPGRILAGKYEVVGKLGDGWEGEVYLVRETATGIERAAKFFFPQRNPGNRALNDYARRLHKLEDCPILIQYRTQERITFRREPVTFLVSDYVPGHILTEFMERQPGRRLQVFEGIHLLHALVCGVEKIHEHGEYHGDLHTDNIIVRRRGLGFDCRLVDLYRWTGGRRDNMRDDVVSLVRILYDVLGGRRTYAKQPAVVKSICRGLRRDLILEKTGTTTRLRRHLETMPW